MTNDVVEEYFPFFKKISYNNKEIFYLDLSKKTSEEVCELVPKTESIIRSQPESSVLFFTNLSDMNYNSSSLKTAKEFSTGNKPYVKKSALIGVTGLKGIAFNTLIKVTGRDNFKLFDNEIAALNWLSQD